MSIPVKLQNRRIGHLEPLAGKVITVINVEHATVHSYACPHAQVRRTIAHGALRCKTGLERLSILDSPQLECQTDLLASCTCMQSCHD